LNGRYEKYHGERVGFFGLFDFIEDVGVAQALLDAAVGQLELWGATKARGPANTPMGDEIGLLTEGFETSPFVMMTYNPPYYVEIYQKIGLHAVKNLHAYYISAGSVPKRVEKVVERIRKSTGLTIRPIRMKQLASELKIIQKLYNETLDRNYGFIPLGDADMDHLAADLKPVVDPELIMIAEKDGVPVGFSMTIPNINEFLLRTRGNGSVLGVTPEYRHAGLGALFYAESMLKGGTKYIGGELSWVEEDNKEIIKGITLMGGKKYKAYRVYETEPGTVALETPHSGADA
jgi:GNAT superfamily N-acetyltransferase